MKVLDTDLAPVKLIEPRVFEDERGFFYESWNRQVFEQAGITERFVQDNHSRSRQGVLRGLHYQISRPQGKLVRVTRGEVFDVAVDLRRSSPEFGRWTGAVLSEENRRQMWIPAGFAHGFLVLSELADFQYKCTDYRVAEHERALRWDDESVAVRWPVPPEGPCPVLSPKDASAPVLALTDHFT